MPRPVGSKNGVCGKCGSAKERGVKCKPCKRAYRLERYRTHRESERAYRNKWDAAHRDQMAAAAKDWRERNMARSNEILRLGCQRRRARLRGAAGTVTAAEWHAILRRYKHKCAHCFIGGELTMDHVVPLARGGSHYAFNIQPLCGPCNSKKNAKLQPGVQHSLFDNLERSAPK